MKLCRERKVHVGVKHKSALYVIMSMTSGAYLATHKSRNFGSDTSKRRTTPKVKF